MDKNKYNLKKMSVLVRPCLHYLDSLLCYFSTLVYFTYGFFLRLETIGVCVSTDSLDLHKHYLAAFFMIQNQCVLNNIMKPK